MAAAQMTMVLAQLPLALLLPLWLPLVLQVWVSPAQVQHSDTTVSTMASKLRAADGTHLLCQQCPAQTAHLATKLGSHLVG